VHGVRGGEPFGYVARLSGVSECLESEDTFDMAHNLVGTPLKGCHDMFVHEECSSLGSNYVIPISLELSHVSFMCSQPSFSPEHSFDVPNDISKLCDSNVDLAMRITCLICLVGMLKILGT